MTTNQGISEIKGLIKDTVRKANSGHTGGTLTDKDQNQL